MMPMTPLQSWAFLALVFALVIAVVCAIAEVERVAARRGAAAQQPDDDADDPLQDAEVETARPQLVLIRSEPDRGPAQVYDWAVQGI